MAFKGKPPGSGSGEMSKRTEALRPIIELTPAQSTKARKLRRQGHEPGMIALQMGVPLEEVEKALVQMRSPRPESTRGTLNVTLAAHNLVLAETQPGEPVWQSFDRIVGELVDHRARERSFAAKLAAIGQLRDGEGVWRALERLISDYGAPRDVGNRPPLPRRKAGRAERTEAERVPTQMPLFGVG